MPLRAEICPACSAPLAVDPPLTRVRCAYCGTPYLPARHGNTVDAPPTPSAPSPAAVSVTPARATFISPQGRSYWVWLLLSPWGSVDRKGFWLGMLVTGALIYLAAMLNRGERFSPLMPLLFLAATYIPIVVSIKRARARQRPPALAFLWFFPIFGPLWLLFDLGILGSEMKISRRGV